MFEHTLNLKEETLRMPRSRETFALWMGIVLGPIAFALDEGVSYMLTQHACSTGHFYVLHLTSVICFLIALAGLFTAWTVYRLLPPRLNDEGGSVMDRSYFMALLGMALSFAFAVAIVAQGVPKMILNPCD